MKNDDLDTLMSLIAETCNGHHIKSFLRAQRLSNSKDIRIGKLNVDHLAQLRSAIENSYITIMDAKKLLWNLESNGDQHIFFYTPKTKKAVNEIKDAARVASCIWGANWNSHFNQPPALIDKPSQPIAASIHEISDSDTSQNGWVLRIYETCDKRMRIVTQINDKEYYSYEDVPTRAPLLIRWTTRGLLEIRVPRWTARYDAVDMMLGTAWTFLSKAVARGDYREWNLPDVCINMMQEITSNHHIYRFIDIGFKTTDGSVTHKFTGITGETGLDEDVETLADLRKALKRGQPCYLTVVVWNNSGSAGALETELLTPVGLNGCNEITIAPQLFPESVDYVINRLFQFSNPEA